MHDNRFLHHMHNTTLLLCNLFDVISLLCRNWDRRLLYLLWITQETRFVIFSSNKFFSYTLEAQWHLILFSLPLSFITSKRHIFFIHIYMNNILLYKNVVHVKCIAYTYIQLNQFLSSFFYVYCFNFSLVIINDPGIVMSLIDRRS